MFSLFPKQNQAYMNKKYACSNFILHLVIFLKKENSNILNIDACYGN